MNKNHDNMNNIIITPGHYCTRNTINSEAKTVIRVYGYDDNKGLYKTDTGYITESDLMNNYIKLDTRMNDTKPLIVSKKLELGDLNLIENSEEVWDNVVMHKITKESITEQPPKEKKPSYVEEKPIRSESEIMIDALIERAYIDDVKKSENKKLQPLKIEFKLDFDLNTIRNGIDFLNLNIDEFCKIFVENQKKVLPFFIRDAIKAQILNDEKEQESYHEMENIEKSSTNKTLEKLVTEYLLEIKNKHSDNEDKEPAEN